MGGLISVIVPVYNVADYVEQCLRSVLEQEYGDLQVIVVDDGSTDGSGDICDRIGAADDRVRVVHQANAGAGAAKNTALALAEGTYLSFVDSDDFLEPDSYRYMVDTLERTGAAAAQFGFREVYRDGAVEHCPANAVMDAQAYLCRFPKDWSCALLWNKLYRRALYDGVRFPEGRRIDDEFFTYRGFLGKGTVVTDGRIVYNYRKRRSSVMSSPASAERRILDNLDATVQRREAVARLHPELKGAFDENYLDVLWYLMANPGATERTVGLLKSHIRGYFRTRGNTFPPRWLWGNLWRAYFTSTEKLLQEAAQADNRPDPERFFP